ncbi:MAG: hypothetical protein ACE5KJ_04600 [Candidatus Zixiibacteriota bacterium]
MLKKLAVEIERNADNVSEGSFDFPSLTLEERWGESNRMPKRRKSNYKMPEKTYWHIYSLQTLNSEKFIKVVNKILKREYILIK